MKNRRFVHLPIYLLLLSALLGSAPAAVAAEGVLQRGMKEYAAKEYFLSILSFKTILKEHPGSPDAVEATLWLARSYVAIGNRPAAGQVIRDLLKQSPELRDRIDPQLLSLTSVHPPASPQPTVTQGAAANPPQTARAEKERPAPAPAKTAPAPKTPPRVAAPTPAPAAPAAPVAPPQSAATATAPAPAESPVPAPVVAAPAAQAAPATPRETGPDGKTTVHRLLVAGFTERKAARRELDKLKQRVPAAFLVHEGDRYFLYAGSFADPQRARNEREWLERQGIVTELRDGTVTLPRR